MLLYHRVGGTSGTSVDLPSTQFDDQMAALARSGAAVALDRAVAQVSATGVPPRVVVTFDDGTADWVDDVLPVLERWKVPATFYVATAFVDEQRSFPDGGRPVSWAGLAEMVSTGLVTIGSHTHSHRVMRRVDAAEAAQELDRSQALIGDRLGVACEHFAYPKAVAPSSLAASEVARRFTTAALGGGGTNPYGGTDLLRLRRIPMQRNDDAETFRRKVDGGFALEGRLRDLYGWWRYRGTDH